MGVPSLWPPTAALGAALGAAFAVAFGAAFAFAFGAAFGIATGNTQSGREWGQPKKPRYAPSLFIRRLPYKSNFSLPRSEK